MKTLHALAAGAVVAALVAAPAAASPDHATRPCQQSLEGRKGAGTAPPSVTQRYVLTLPGSPSRGTGLHDSYADRVNPAPAGDSPPPSPGMIVLLAVLALVGRRCPDGGAAVAARAVSGRPGGAGGARRYP